MRVNEEEKGSMRVNEKEKESMRVNEEEKGSMRVNEEELGLRRASTRGSLSLDRSLDLSLFALRRSPAPLARRHLLPIATPTRPPFSLPPSLSIQLARETECLLCARESVRVRVGECSEPCAPNPDVRASLRSMYREEPRAHRRSPSPSIRSLDPIPRARPESW